MGGEGGGGTVRRGDFSVVSDTDSIHTLISIPLCPSHLLLCCHPLLFSSFILSSSLLDWAVTPLLLCFPILFSSFIPSSSLLSSPPLLFFHPLLFSSFIPSSPLLSSPPLLFFHPLLFSSFIPSSSLLNNNNNNNLYFPFHVTTV